MNYKIWIAVSLILLIFQQRVMAMQYEPAPLEMFVNQVDQGEAFVLLGNQDVLVLVSDLEDAGIHGFSGKREVVKGKEYVSLLSLKPDIAFEVDEEAAVLRLVAQPSFLGKTTQSLGYGAPEGIVHSKNTSFFFNYSISSQDFKQFSSFQEAGLSLSGNLLYGSFLRDTKGAWIRDLTNYTVDDPPRLKRIVLGDTFAGTSDPLGGGFLLAGINYSRNFSLDPYFVRSPSIGVSGALLTPSKVNVYVNGLLVRQMDLPPGRFSLENLPVTSGSGVTTLVIRDAFGHEQQINSPYFFSSQLLKKGLQEYSFNLGFQRNGFGMTSWDYGAPAFLGSERVGISDSLTAGLRLEAEPGLVSTGGVMDTLLPFGQITVSAAASSSKGLSGKSAFAAYSYPGKLISFNLLTQFSTPYYSNLGLSPLADRPLFQTTAGIGMPIGKLGSAAFQYSSKNFRDSGRTDQISLTGTFRLTQDANLFLSTGHSNPIGGKPFNSLLLNLSYYFGGETTGNFSYTEQGGMSTQNIQIQKSVPSGVGFGYNLQAAQNQDSFSRSVELRFNGPSGVYDLENDAANGKSATSLNVSGGIAEIGGSFYFTRPVQQSFALVQVPGVKGVRVYSSNQEAGRTDAGGNFLIPDLISYYGNQIGISNQDIPLNYGINQTEKIISLPNRGGAVVAFPVYRLQILVGRIVIIEAGKEIVPAFGEMIVTADRKKFDSPLGDAGEFYLENLPPGKHSGEILYHGITYRIILQVPVTDSSLVDLGELRFTSTLEKGVMP